MKQLTILSGRCLVVELPEGAIDFKFKALYASSGIKSILDFLVDGSKQHVELPVPDGCKPWHLHWRIIGMLSEVREDDLTEIVVDGCYVTATHFAFIDHVYNIYTCSTRIESLESAILAEGWCFELKCSNCGKTEDEQAIVPHCTERWCLDCMRLFGHCITCDNDIRLSVNDYYNYEEDQCPACLNGVSTESNDNTSESSEPIVLSRERCLVLRRTGL